MRSYFFLFFLLLVSCAREDKDYFLQEGRRIQERLIDIVENIETKDELLNAKKELQRGFSDLVDLMIQARLYQKRTNSSWKPQKEDLILSQKLEKEMERLLRIPGAREILEKCYEEPLLLLTKYEN